MEHAGIELGRTYLRLYGDARYHVTPLDKSNSLILVRLDSKLAAGREIRAPEAAEIGAELWGAPEAIEPPLEGGATPPMAVLPQKRVIEGR